MYLTHILNKSHVCYRCPLSGHGLFICIVYYIKPSINASNLSIFRSIIHFNIKLCNKTEQNQQILSKNAFNTTLGEKTPRHGRDLGRDSAIMGVIP